MLQSSELLKKNLTELKNLLREYQGELYLLKFKASTGQLDTTHKIKLVRRDIARVQTIINQKLQNKEQPPKVVKSKTPKTVTKPENGVESDAQTLESSDLSPEAGFESSPKETQVKQVTHNSESLKTDKVAEAKTTKETELLEAEGKEENKEVKEKESD